MQNKEILKSTSKSYYFSRRLGVSLKPFDVPEIFLNLLKTLNSYYPIFCWLKSKIFTHRQKFKAFNG